MIAEQAGGGATSGRRRFMEILPENILQRIPFTIGSLKEIETYERIYTKDSRS